MAPFDRSLYYFRLLVGCCKYSSVLYHFRDKARYWSKITIFYTPPAFDAPVRRVRIRILSYHLIRKTRMVWLPDGEKKSEDMISHFDRIPAHDRRMDGHLATAESA